jgi:hypothetical protein
MEKLKFRKAGLKRGETELLTIKINSILIYAIKSRKIVIGKFNDNSVGMEGTMNLNFYERYFILGVLK